MFLYQMITSFTIIYLFFQNVNVIKASDSQQRCQKGTRIWLCSNGKQCGDTYESCNGDLGTLDTNAIIILIVFSIFVLAISCTNLYYFCIHRKRLAASRSTQQMQTISNSHAQQQVVYYVDPNIPTNTELPITEASPPSYEPTQSKKLRDGHENV